MSVVEAVGYVAASLTTIAFIPQAVKVLKERDTRSLSLGMYLIFTCGVLLWAVYGAFRQGRCSPGLGDRDRQRSHWAAVDRDSGDEDSL